MTTKSRTPPHLFTIILLTAFSPLSLNMFLPSLGNIARDLETDYALASVAIAGYLAATAVIQLIAGPMSDRFGRRPVLLVALTLFTIASVVCSLAENIWVFLAFRMLQGGVSAGYTLSLAIVRDTNPPQKAAGLIGYISMCMAIAPMLGPVLGGILDTAFGWRSNFYAYSLCGAALLLLCWIDLGETRPGHDTDHPEQSGTAEHGTPFSLIRDPRFCAYVLCTAFSVGAFYIFLAGAPLVATTTFGISTAELGFFIGSITLGFSAGGFLSGRFASRVSLTAMMLTGRIIACLGMTTGLALVSLGWVSPLIFFASTIFVGFGNGITIPGSNSGAMSVNPALAGSAAGMIGALTLAGGAVLTSLTGLAIETGDRPKTVLALMLASSAIGFLAAFAAHILERRERFRAGEAW
ncbi:MAG: multidrug effflux MFS transporter [Roseibium sp.]|uniref:multidrug effflux MFS transporter n=1 Tax=Roseibium sp. TaxID=1936156 RepID=UPI002620FC6D|nr:multidrug effflux MFS transporter [Roseibium sp.]MCV0424585.1 multidrug effflux MFS transporter [Roseibium sp.]